MPRLNPTTIALSIALALSGIAPSAQALGIGNLNLRSHLGEPLRAIVPVRLEGGETLDRSCVRVLAQGADDGVPNVPGVVVGVERTVSGATVLVLSTRAAINEPIARVTLDVGCDGAITRDFVMLIDPPTAAPVAEMPAPSVPASAVAPAPEVIAAAPAKATPARPAGRAASTAPRAAAAPKPRTDKSARAPAADKSAPAAKPAPAAREATKPAQGRDQLRLVEPVASVSNGMRVADTLPAQVVADEDRAKKFRDEQARLMATLQDKDPATVPSAREAKLAQQLEGLGNEINALKKQMAEQAERAQAERHASAPMWLVYVLGGVAALALGAVALLLLRGRRRNNVMVGAPWWADTLMRTDNDKPPVKGKTAPAPKAPAQAPSPQAPVQESDVVYPKAPTDPTATAPGRVSRRLVDHDAGLSERVQDTTIEVHELGATQALQMLRRTTPSADLLKAVAQEEHEEPLPDALKPRTGEGPKFDASMTLSSLDFDLGAPTQDNPLATLPQAIRSGEVPILPPVEPTTPADVWASASTGDAPAPALAATPEFLTRAPQAMTWSDARQAQDYLRQVAESIEQADAYVAAGQAESAASVLRKLISDRQGGPRAPWLMLLQLYRKTDKREAYEALAQRFAERFGRNAAAWTAEPPSHEAGLDSDPDLLQAIWARWGSPESMGLLSKLLYDADAPDTSFLNLTLQRDLLNFVKICPLDGG